MRRNSELKILFLYKKNRETFAQPNNNEILDNHDVPLYNHPFGNFNHVLRFF